MCLGACVEEGLVGEALNRKKKENRECVRGRLWKDTEMKEIEGDEKEGRKKSGRMKIRGRKQGK